MRLGINWVPKHNSAEDWARQLAEMGCRASVFPADHTAPTALIDSYVRAAADRDICIAEVGVWNSPVADDPAAAERSYAFAKGQLELADYVGARCCVNVSGAGRDWFMAYRDNYSGRIFDRNVEVLRRLIDEVKPTRTYYTLEMMQWMLPDSPEQYIEILRAVNRERLAVHVDVVNLVRDPIGYFHHNELIDRTFNLLSGRIRSCHLKDLMLPTGVTVVFEEVLPGEGAIDLAHYGRCINREDQDLPLLIEHLSGAEQYLKALAHVQALYQAEGIAL